MDNKDPCLLEEPHALGIFKTLYLFLQSHNFPKAAETLRKEWGLDKDQIEKVSNKTILLTRCKCCRSQANQTDVKPSKYNHDWLEGTFQGETFQIKPDDTHVFYVCDHCQKKTKSKIERSERNQILNEVFDDGNISDAKSPRHEAKKLKSKFSRLQDEHQKLIAVTSELTTALQMNIMGQTKNIYSVLEQCKIIYPSLFENGSPQMRHCDHGDKLDNNQNIYPDIQLKAVHSDESKESNNMKVTITRASQFPENPQPLESSSPRLNLEKFNSASPLLSPMTPETVRCVLESVFERIFEMERCKSANNNSKSPPLNKDDVVKIVGDVLGEAMRPPSNAGAGEGEHSRPESVCVMRNDTDWFYIDYGKLKTDLMHSDDERKIRILQALRWRITKSDGPTREKVLEAYITNDILDLFTGISIPERLLLGYGTDHYVQESTCRLINTLASLRQGRDYLTLDERLLKRVLIKKVKDVRSVSGAVIRNMLVASVQKLSIRKQCRTHMVYEGLFEVMVDYLDEFYEKLSKYCLEYCSALLMNLCLVDEAKDRSTRNPKKIVGLLRKFLESENEFCLPYINGVMFSLFEKSEIVSEAIHQNLDKTIINLIQIVSNESVKKQLDFILQSRLFGKSDPKIHDEDDDGKEEVDLLEVELDQDDFITQLPSGEKLLQEYKTDIGSMNMEKPNSVSFCTMKRDPPNSAKSFFEETKQFVHKPSSERGIFETAKPRRNTTCSQYLIKNYVRNKAFNQSSGRYATPQCYMENCQKLLQGYAAQCSCSKCEPGQSKYSCGCYEAIRRDIADNGDDLNSFPHNRDTESKCSQPKSHEVVKASNEVAKAPENISNKSAVPAQSTTTIAIGEETLIKYKDNGGRNRNGCKVCGEKKCECAFESRPKLCRTPTL